MTWLSTQTGQVVAVSDRPRNVLDGNGMVAVPEGLIGRLLEALGQGQVLEWYMDGRSHKGSE